MTDAYPDSARPAPHVLVVDDDPGVRELLQDYLSRHELRVSTAADGPAAMAAFDTGVVDLVLLDLRLPGEDGLSLARRLHARSPVPIVLLTGRSEEADRVMGLELGADDYVTKPFSPRELLARIRAVLRRTLRGRQAAGPGAIEAEWAEEGPRAHRFAGWELNLRIRRLQGPGGRVVDLSNHEFNLLVAFCGAAQRVLTREQLLALSRLNGAEVYDRTVDVQVLRLRRKIEADPLRPVLIVTVRGAGYCLDAPVETLY